MACTAGQESPYNPGWFYTGAVAGNGGCIMVAAGTAYSGSADIITRVNPNGGAGGVSVVGERTRKVALEQGKFATVQGKSARNSRFGVEHPTTKVVEPFSATKGPQRLISTNFPNGGTVPKNAADVEKKPCGCKGTTNGSNGSKCKCNKRAHMWKGFAIKFGITSGLLILLFGLVGMFGGGKGK